MKATFTFAVDGLAVDRFRRLKASMLLYYMQEAAGKHFEMLKDPRLDTNLFWAVTRHSLVINRLPMEGETVTVETWPMPTTRVAYPRAVYFYDEAGNELARATSLWVLMDPESRTMVLPGKSGVEVQGFCQGDEVPVPRSLPSRPLENSASRSVTYSLLDVNGHMNNTRYLDWVMDLPGSCYHAGHTPREITVCYLTEALEGQDLTLGWQLEDGLLQVDAHRDDARVFAAQVKFAANDGQKK